MAAISGGSIFNNRGILIASNYKYGNTYRRVKLGRDREEGRSVSVNLLIRQK
jgi:hypothetical protein